MPGAGNILHLRLSSTVSGRQAIRYILSCNRRRCYRPALLIFFSRVAFFSFLDEMKV